MIHRTPQPPIKFVIVGVANTLLGLAVIFLCKWLLDFRDLLANLSGYAVGLMASFVMNRNWTFDHVGSVIPAFARFLVVFATAYLFNLGLVLSLIRWAGMNSYVAQAAGILPYAALFYLGSRYFAFRQTPGPREGPKGSICSR